LSPEVSTASPEPVAVPAPEANNHFEEVKQEVENPYLAGLDLTMHKPALSLTSFVHQINKQSKSDDDDSDPYAKSKDPMRAAFYGEDTDDSSEYAAPSTTRYVAPYSYNYAVESQFAGAESDSERLAKTDEDIRKAFEDSERRVAAQNSNLGRVALHDIQDRIGYKYSDDSDSSRSFAPTHSDESQDTDPDMEEFNEQEKMRKAFEESDRRMAEFRSHQVDTDTDVSGTIQRINDEERRERIHKSQDPMRAAWYGDSYSEPQEPAPSYAEGKVDDFSASAHGLYGDKLDKWLYSKTK